jgi:hypothetical protein
MNVDTCRATYVSHAVAPGVRQDPDGDLEILVSNPIGVFGTHRLMDEGRGEQLPSLEELVHRPGWMELAACAGMPIETFFPGRGENHKVAAAKAVCAVCSVRTECYDYAQSFTETPVGVWGGESERSRKRFAGVPYSCPVAIVAKGDTALTCTNTGQSVVEVAGIEPASSGVSIGLLRAQPARNCRGRHHCWRLSRPVFN